MVPRRAGQGNGKTETTRRRHFIGMGVAWSTATAVMLFCGRSLDDAIGIGQIHKRIVFDIHHAHDAQLFEYQRDSFAEHLFLLRQRARKRNGADLAASD